METNTHPIFERDCSPLYRSNDRRLYVEKQRDMLAGFVYAVKAEGEGDDETIFATFDRVKVDAYIAGYDEAERLARERIEQILQSSADAEGDDPTGHRITL